MEDLFILNISKFYYKLVTGILPNYFSSYRMFPQGTLHNYPTRYPGQFRTNFTRTKFAEKCLRHHLPKVINELPDTLLDTITTHCIKSFSSKVKDYLLEKYSNICLIENCYICNKYRPVISGANEIAGQ